MRGSRRQTIVDVAHRAGVSKSTAARALSNAPEISEATRDKVLEAARALGYERNHLAVGMRSGRSGMLGLLIPDIANPFWAEVARGAQDRAADAGASLLVFSSDWEHAREARHLQALRQARVDGVIINRHLGFSEPYMAHIQRLGIPAVFLNVKQEFDCVHSGLQPATTKLPRCRRAICRSPGERMQHSCRQKSQPALPPPATLR